MPACSVCFKSCATDPVRRHHIFSKHQVQVKTGDGFVSFRRPNPQAPWQCTNADCGMEIPLSNVVKGKVVDLKADTLRKHQCHLDLRAAKKELAAQTAEKNRQKEEKAAEDERLDMRVKERASARAMRRENDPTRHKRFRDVADDIAASTSRLKLPFPPSQSLSELPPQASGVDILLPSREKRKENPSGIEPLPHKRSRRDDSSPLLLNPPLSNPPLLQTSTSHSPSNTIHDNHGSDTDTGTESDDQDGSTYGSSAGQANNHNFNAVLSTPPPIIPDFNEFENSGVLADAGYMIHRATGLVRCGHCLSNHYLDPSGESLMTHKKRTCQYKLFFRSTWIDANGLLIPPRVWDKLTEAEKANYNEDLMAAAKLWQVNVRPRPSTPSNPISPLPFIEGPVAGSYCVTCEWVSRATSRFRHGAGCQKALRAIRSCFVQQPYVSNNFRSKNGRKHGIEYDGMLWVVKRPEASAAKKLASQIEIESRALELLEDLDHSHERMAILSTKDASREIPLLIKQLGWDKYIPTQSPKDSLLYRLQTVTHYSIDTVLKAGVVEWFDTACLSIKKLGREPLIRLGTQTPNAYSRGIPHPLQAPESKESYIRDLWRLIRFLLQQLSPSSLNLLPVAWSDSLVGACIGLEEILCGGFEEHIDELRVAIHDVLLALFSTLNTIDVSASIHTPLHPLQAFLMVTNINDYGVFKSGQRISSSCSTIVWGLRAFLAIEVATKANNTSEQLRLAIELASRYLELDHNSTPTVMSFIRTISGTASRAAATEGHVPSCFWSPSYDFCEVKGVPVNLHQLPKLYSSGLRELEAGLEKLAHGPKLQVDAHLLSELSKNPENLPAHQLATKPLLAFWSILPPDRIKELQSKVLSRLTTDMNICERQGNKLKFSIPFMVKYMKMSGSFIQSLAVMIHITCGQPARATELEKANFANFLSERSFFIQNGRVTIVLRHVKTEHRGPSIKFRSHHLPEDVGNILILYLLHIRPVEELFAAALNWKDAGLLAFKLFYLRSKQGATPNSATWITEPLSQMFRAVLGIWMCVSVWRHLLTAVGRLLLLDAGLGDSNVMDDQAGRAQTTSHQTYAVEATLNSSVAVRHAVSFRRASESCHLVLFGIESDGRRVSNIGLIKAGAEPNTTMVDGLRQVLTRVNQGSQVTATLIEHVQHFEEVVADKIGPPVAAAVEDILSNRLDALESIESANEDIFAEMRKLRKQAEGRDEVDHSKDKRLFQQEKEIEALKDTVKELKENVNQLSGDVKALLRHFNIPTPD